MPIRVTQFLQQPHVGLKQPSEQGFTLLESLMGVVVISIVIVAMTPPIFLAVGTRVQNRRAEQAMHLAQAEIDRIRVLVEQGDYTIDKLPAVPVPAPSASSDIKNMPPPTTLPGNNIKSDNSNCSAPYTVNQLPANKAWRVDIDRDCKMDFLVQTFRDRGDIPDSAPASTLPMAFRVGVRVYAAVAEQNVANLETPPQQPASLKFTTGLGKQRSRALAVIYTTIARSDAPASLKRYHELLP